MFCYCFGTGKHFINRNDEKLTINSCSAHALKDTLVMHFKFQEVYYITCKPSLLICSKILLQYY